MNWEMSEENISDIVTCKRGAIERALITAQKKFADYQKQKATKRAGRSKREQRTVGRKQSFHSIDAQKSNLDSAGDIELTICISCFFVAIGGTLCKVGEWVWK